MVLSCVKAKMMDATKSTSPVPRVIKKSYTFMKHRGIQTTGLGWLKTSVFYFLTFKHSDFFFLYSDLHISTNFSISLVFHKYPVKEHPINMHRLYSEYSRK